MASESKVHHKIVVEFYEIKFDVEKPNECIIRYQYDLFCTFKVSTRAFPICQEDSNYQAIPSGFNCQRQFSVSSKDLKQHLEQNLLEIQITDQTGTNFGSSKIDLSKIYGPESDKMWFGLRYMVDTPILKACEGKADQRVGMLKCLFVVETEDCVRCKSCNEYFKETTILKHVTHDKTCGPKFSTNDIQSLKDMAKERKRKRRNQRHKNTYSPTKRAKIHKETYDPAKQKANYDPVKRKEKYDPLKRAELYRQEKKEEEDERKKIYEVARQDHSESMSKETKLENQLRFEETKEQFEMACKWIKDSNITEDVRETLQNVVLEMQKLKRILEDEIDTATGNCQKSGFH